MEVVSEGIMARYPLSLHATGDGVVPIFVVVALAGQTGAGTIKDRHSQSILDIYSKFFEVEMEVEITGWDGVEVVAGMLEAKRVQSCPVSRPLQRLHQAAPRMRVNGVAQHL